jgi:hypothetical protein
MDGYDTDIALWSATQASLLRQHAATARPGDNAIDWPNIIEEVEALGRSERSALASQVRTILEHLMKLAASPAEAPRAGWRQTVLRARAAVEELLEVSPSLRPSLDAVVERETRRVRPLVADALAALAFGEAPVVGLDGLAFTVEQVAGDWWPQSTRSSDGQGNRIPTPRTGCRGEK